jgi:hypothetical protein
MTSLSGQGFSVSDDLAKYHDTPTVFYLFLYSLSISTTYGEAPVSPNCPIALLIGNVHTIVTQIIFLFATGVIFARLSQVRARG